jgi:hypothetical protein
MFWVEKHAKMVRFIDGVVEVDDMIGKEMLACGYKQEGVETVSSPKRVVEPKQEKVVVEKKAVPPTPSTMQPKFKV